jgi:hypothetical protein
MEGSQSRLLDMARRRLGDLNNVGGGVGVKASTTCNIGATSVEPEVTNYGDYMYLWYVNSGTCSGTLTTFNIYSYDDVGASIAVCLYKDNGDSGVPEAVDTLVGCTSSPIADAATQWVSGAASGGTVTASTGYYFALIADGGNWSKGASGSNLFRVCTNCRDSPPANLAGTWSGSSDGTDSVYVTVTP